MKPRSAKNKGRRFQNYIRDKILEVFKDHLHKDDVVSTPMGVSGEDIQISPHARQYFPYSAECKANKSFAVYKIMEQAERHGKGIPIVFLKGDRKEPLALLTVEEFFRLLLNNNNNKDNL